ncbi:Nicotinate phosphoribosyltransferase [Rhizoctonia solani]|uniref:nicotinate phosphoribosyltransferase n=1 Tax=Rhizoctonia solani TaxID=456999 RepID=A0A8H7IB21_9AGAM|nr:Nicotinate phosphoribosyltransferase [Rhizoctonia solani]
MGGALELGVAYDLPLIFMAGIIVRVLGVDNQKRHFTFGGSAKDSDCVISTVGKSHVTQGTLYFFYSHEWYRSLYFSSKTTPKVQVGHPPLPPLKDVPEERILEIYGPQLDQLRDALEALCDRLNGRDAGYFFDSSGVRTFIVLENPAAVDEAIANRDKLIIDPIQASAQDALSSMVFSRATESFELREFMNFASSGAGLGTTLSPLHSPRPFGGGMHAPLTFSALPPPALPINYSGSRIGSPSISALGLVNPRTPSPPRKSKTALELGLETLAQQWGSPSPEATRVFRSIGSPRNTPLGARLFSPLHNYNASDDELTRGRGRSRHISNDIHSDPTLPAAKKVKRHASSDVSRVMAADVLNDLLERMRCELWVGVPRLTRRFPFISFSCSELMVDPHALTNTHCGHSFCCLCIIRHIIDSLPEGLPNPAFAPQLIRCPSCDIDGSPPGSPSPSPSPGSRRGLISRQTTLASIVSSVYETLIHEEVEGWVPPDEFKRRSYDNRVEKCGGSCGLERVLAKQWRLFAIERQTRAAITSPSGWMLTMQQAILHHFPKADVTYRFTNRAKEMLFSRECFELAKQSIARQFQIYFIVSQHSLPSETGLSELQLTVKEAEWLKDNCPYFTEEYISYLRSYRFRPNEQVKMDLHVTSEPGAEVEEGHITMEISGLWVETIPYEVPVMSILSEAYFLTVDRGWTYEGQEELAYQKAKQLIKAGISFSDFGTRRRRSYHGQDLVLQGLIRGNKEFSGQEARGRLSSTSNIAAIHGYENANGLAMDLWEATYPTSKSNALHIALTDTFSTDAFNLNFTTDRARAERWRGLRQDSGDPFEFIVKARSAYEEMGIDYRKKVIVFSDGLDVELSIKIQKAIEEAGFIGAYGIGTFLTNDYKRMDNGQRSKPLNMVIKIASVEGQPCVKISDDITKNTGDPEVVAQIKKRFGIAT